MEYAGKRRPTVVTHYYYCYHIEEIHAVERELFMKNRQENTKRNKTEILAAFSDVRMVLNKYGAVSKIGSILRLNEIIHARDHILELQAVANVNVASDPV